MPPFPPPHHPVIFYLISAKGLPPRSPNFSTILFHPFNIYLSILVGILQVEYKTIVTSQNHPQDSLCIPHKSLN